MKNICWYKAGEDFSDNIPVLIDQLLDTLLPGELFSRYMKFTNLNIDTSFEKGILHVKFLNNAVVTERDLQEIYQYGTKCSNALPYCALFEALGEYEVREEALAYINKNPHNIFILAKAYVMNTKEAEKKIRLHLIFDNPALKPCTFMTAEEAKGYLRGVMADQI